MTDLMNWCRTEFVMTDLMNWCRTEFVVTDLMNWCRTELLIGSVKGCRNPLLIDPNNE